MAVRRSAIERAGPFDEARELYGDEQEWQARVKAAGGRIRYVAGAALDHRRAGDDARLRALCRAAYRRGQASRRFDVFKGTAPSLAAELRVLAGCAAARPAARVHERPGAHRALARAPARGAGGAGRRGRRRGLPLGHQRHGRRQARRAAARARRVARRARGAAPRAPAPRRAPRAAAPARARGGRRAPRLAHGRRARRAACAAATRSTSSPRPQGERGKFENLNALLAAHPPAAYDWLLVIDDDVALPRGFLDAFLCAAERTGLKLAQPAHRLHSHAAWPVTRRHPGATARETTFVEIGPVTAFHRDSFDVLLPFPEGLRDGLGARRPLGRASRREHGWPIGIVDATPIGHTQQPAGSGYARDAAEARGARVPRRPALRAPRRGPHAGGAPVKVAIVSEFYPRAHDPVLGVWAHRQALAARDAGADVRVLVLHRPVPPRATAPARRAGRPAHPGLPAAACRARRPRRALRAVPRPAALAQLRVLGRVGGADPRRRPAQAARGVPLRPRPRPQRGAGGRRRAARARSRAPLVVSVHGGDVYFTAPRHPAGARAVRRALGQRAARAGQLGRHRGRGAAPRRARARASCAWAPTSPSSRRTRTAAPTLVTVAHLVARKRHADVVRALWLLRERHPELRYLDHRRRPRARAAGAPGRRAGRGRPRRVRRPAPARGGARARAAPATCSSCPASTRPSASPTSRRWPPGCRRSPRAARPGPQEIVGRRRRAAPRPARRRRGAGGRARRAAGRARLPAGARRARPRHRRAAPSRGRSAGARRCRPTRTRCGERRRALRHQPRPARPRRRVPRAARARAARARALRRALASRDGRARGPRRALPPRRPARGPRPGRRAGATRRSCAGRRAASRCPPPSSAPSARAPRSCSGARCGATCTPRRTSPRARCCATSTAARRSSSATGRTSPRTPGGSARARSPSRPRRSTTPSGRRRSPRTGRGRSRRCSSGATCPRRAWRCCARPGGAPGSPAARLARASEPTRVVGPEQVRNSYAAADVLVIPSLATRHFLEPWGLVANEAMNQHLPVIATDAVGAAAGGLVRHERNGLVVRAGDPDALAAALRTLHDDPALRARLGANAAHDVARLHPRRLGRRPSPTPCAARPAGRSPC